VIRTNDISPASGDTVCAICERRAVKTDRTRILIVLDTCFQLQQHDVVWLVSLPILVMLHDSFHSVSSLCILFSREIVSSHHYLHVSSGKLFPVRYESTNTTSISCAFCMGNLHAAVQKIFTCFSIQNYSVEVKFSVCWTCAWTARTVIDLKRGNSSHGAGPLTIIWGETGGELSRDLSIWFEIAREDSSLPLGSVAAANNKP